MQTGFLLENLKEKDDFEDWWNDNIKMYRKE